MFNRKWVKVELTNFKAGCTSLYSSKAVNILLKIANFIENISSVNNETGAVTLTLRSIVMFLMTFLARYHAVIAQFFYYPCPLRKITSVTVVPLQSGLYGERGGPHQPAIHNTTGKIRCIGNIQIITTQN